MNFFAHVTATEIPWMALIAVGGFVAGTCLALGYGLGRRSADRGVL